MVATVSRAPWWEAKEELGMRSSQVSFTSRKYSSVGQAPLVSRVVNSLE